MCVTYYVGSVALICSFVARLHLSNTFTRSSFKLNRSMRRRDAIFVRTNLFPCAYFSSASLITDDQIEQQAVRTTILFINWRATSYELIVKNSWNLFPFGYNLLVARMSMYSCSRHDNCNVHIDEKHALVLRLRRIEKKYLRCGILRLKRLVIMTHDTHQRIFCHIFTFLT